MAKEPKSTLPSHLMDLLYPTPSGTAKLIAAWDGLSVETQLQILGSLDEARFPWYLAQKVRRKALDSPNAYVRYLAAREFDFGGEDNEEGRALKERIEMDSDPLVRYCLFEGKSEWKFFDEYIKDPQLFFSLPHEARLAKVRKLRGGGEAIASLIAYALDNCLEQGQVSEIELYEILADYIVKPSFREDYGEGRWANRYDGFGEYMVGKDVEALWALVIKVPEGISRVLIEHLPEKAGLSPGIPQNILEKLTPAQLETLLYRKDIVLKDFRKKIFEQSTERLDSVRSAAISCNFDLSYDDFSKILARPDSQKIDLLRDLSVMAGDLSLIFYEALYDILSTVDDSWSQAFGMAQIAFEIKIENLTGSQRKKQLRELRLYRLAKQAVPWETGEKGYTPRDKLEFLANLCVDGDTWATFRNFSNEWAKRWDAEKLEKFLPRIHEVEEGDKEEAFGDGTDDHDEIMIRVEKRVADLITSVDRLKVFLFYVVIGLVGLLVGLFIL